MRLNKQTWTITQTTDVNLSQNLNNIQATTAVSRCDSMASTGQHRLRHRLFSLLMVRQYNSKSWSISRNYYDRKLNRNILYIFLEAIARRCFVKKLFLEISQKSQENNCARDSFLIKPQACNFIKKESLTQMFSCELGNISKNSFFNRKPPHLLLFYHLIWCTFWLFQNVLISEISSIWC